MNIDFPDGYQKALTDSRRSRYFPNLTEQNFFFKSLKTDDYNCAAFVLNIEDEWIEFKDEYGNLDVNLQTYINYYKSKGFEEIDSIEIEDNKFKIAIYYIKESLEFKHVAFQIAKGKWKSKLGDWEDIEHENLETLFGSSYGNAVVYMRKEL